jgi:hypothetical protein
MVTNLSESDREAFEQLQSCVGSRVCKYARSHIKPVFSNLLYLIMSFCHRSDHDRSRRYAACGVCPLSQTLGVNTQRLAEVLKRSKSSVNAMLCEIGFIPVASPSPDLAELKLTLRLQVCADLRRWTIRVFAPQRVVLPEQQEDGWNEDVWNWDADDAAASPAFNDPSFDFL